MGAGPLPVVPAHARVPARPLDAAAAEAFRARIAPAGTPGRLASLGAWLAACSGSAHPAVRGRIVAVTDVELPSQLAADVVRVVGRDSGPLEVGGVAAAVDAGRELAREAASDGISVLVGAMTDTTATTSALSLAAWLTGRPAAELTGADDDGAAVHRVLARHSPAIRGPLGALRRLGGEAAATLCGLALGAGEQGLACVCDGLTATAAAGIAVAIEPPLSGRVLAAGRSPEAAHAALLVHLGLVPVLADGADGAAALGVLREACAAGT